MSDGAIKKISRVIFWRYRRGGWQYDILCILILLFIFLVPRSVLDGSYFHEGDSGPAISNAGDSQSPGTPAQAASADDDAREPAAD